METRRIWLIEYFHGKTLGCTAYRDQAEALRSIEVSGHKTAKVVPFDRVDEPPKSEEK